jgi:RNA-directed DNA polymerase
VAHHTDLKWVLMYVQRWLTAPMQYADGSVVGREKGTPQGAPISPLLSNLFMHYALDVWISREYPGIQFERYGDDVIVHCASEDQAREVLGRIAGRLAEFGLELHPNKTRIVYCKDADRREDHDNTSFTFLSYTFRPRLAKNRWGKHFVSFLPAVSRDEVVRMQREIRSWHLPRRSDKSLQDLAHMFNPIVRGWINYYGYFYKSMLYPVLKHLNRKLTMWAMRKYRRLKRRERRARERLRTIASREPTLFAHWKFGVHP